MKHVLSVVASCIKYAVSHVSGTSVNVLVAYKTMMNDTVGCKTRYCIVYVLRNWSASVLLARETLLTRLLSRRKLGRGGAEVQPSAAVTYGR